jgi:hypothetical protein
VGKDLGLETKLADRLAVCARLFRGRRRGELDVLYTKGIEGLGDCDFGLGVEEGIGKLLSLCNMLERVNDRERDRPLRVLSIILKLDMLDKKSDGRGA